MAAENIIILLSLLAVTSNVHSQFYDLFQGFQPFVQSYQTTKRPDFLVYPQENSHKRPKPARNHGNTETSNDRTTVKPKRKQTTAQLFNLNIFTTPKPLKKTTKNSSHRTNTNKSTTKLNSRNQDNNRRISSTDNRRQWYDDSANNIASDYYTERPVFATTKNYNERPHSNSRYTTHNPLYNRPGVRPAIVDINQPPITNRPVTNRPVTHRPLAVYPRPTDSSVIRFPEDPDTSPELILGPDEDKMSYAEKRRYIEIAERMCDKYKALSVKKLQAIPLVPSPEPVQVNVSVCPPTNVPLVVGGKVVTIQEFPHMALLGWTKIQEGGYSWKCGGSLISDQYVLTAGHCAYQEKDDTVVTGAPRVVQLGSSYLDDQGALVMRVQTVVRHPKYVQNRSYYDVALVKLVKPVSFSEVVKPACLGEPPGVGEPIIATGWGRTEFGGTQSLELRSVSIPVWDMDECRQVLGTSRKLPNGPSRDSQICAGEKRGGKDTCQGDSGGPAQIQDGCTWRVVAVTSVGRSCGAPNTPALYATVHKAFIAAQIFGKTSQNAQTNTGNNRNQNNNANSNNNNNRNNANSNINRNNQNNYETNTAGNRNQNNNVNSQTNYNNNRNQNNANSQTNYNTDRNQYNTNSYNTNGNDYGSNNRQVYFNNPSTESAVYDSNNNWNNYNNNQNTNNNGNSRLNNNRRTDSYDNLSTNYDSRRPSNNNGQGYQGAHGNDFNNRPNRNNNDRSNYYTNQDYTAPEQPYNRNNGGWWTPFVF